MPESKPTHLRTAWNKLSSSGEMNFGNILENGILTEGIRPLKSIKMDQIGPIQLFKTGDEYVSILFDDLTVTALSNISANHLTFLEDNKFEIELSLNNLSLSGNCTVFQSVASGSAIHSANGILNMFGENAYVNNVQSSDDDQGQKLNPDYQYIQQSIEYRTTLKSDEYNANNNGNTLVDTYYKNNDAISQIMSETNGFTANWPIHVSTIHGVKGSINSAGCCNQTYVSANDPNNKDKTICDELYLYHSHLMKFMFARAACNKVPSGSSSYCSNKNGNATEKDLQQGSTDTKFLDLIKDMQNFDKNSKVYDSPITVGEVMEHVKTKKSEEVIEVQEVSPIILKAEEEAKRMYDEWQMQYGHLEGRPIHEVHRKTLIQGEVLAPVINESRVVIRGRIVDQNNRYEVVLEEASVPEDTPAFNLGLKFNTDASERKTVVKHFNKNRFIHRVFYSRFDWLFEEDSFLHHVQSIINYTLNIR